MRLIDEVRNVTGAEATDFSDDEIRAALDRNRYLLDFQEIDWRPRIYGGGSIEYKRGSVFTPYALEAGTAGGSGGTVQDSLGGTITGWTLDRDGWITFSADQAGSARFFSGFAYDVNTACAEVCDSWAASVKTLVDVSSDDQSLKLSQRYTTIKDLAAQFRRRAPIQTGGLTRGDAK